MNCSAIRCTYPFPCSSSVCRLAEVQWASFAGIRHVGYAAASVNDSTATDVFCLQHSCLSTFVYDNQFKCEARKSCLTIFSPHMLPDSAAEVSRRLANAWSKTLELTCSTLYPLSCLTALPTVRFEVSPWPSWPHLPAS
jgi:hypothetical protein